MPITAQLHDGTRLEFPDGTDPAVIQRTVKSVIGGAQKPAEPYSLVKDIGDTLRSIPRQVGLTARYGIEGAAQAGDIVHEPIRAAVNAVGGLAGKSNAAPKSLGEMGSGLADMLGLPKPQNATERVVGDASRLVAGTIGGSSAAQSAAKVTSGGTQALMQGLASNPGQQAISAAGGGFAGGSVRESGGSPTEQFVASLVGGVAAPMAANKLESAGKRLVSAMTPQAAKMQAADMQISLMMQRQGIDWDSFAPDVKNSLRKEIADALATGKEIDPQALKRLAVFRATRTTPTVGMLTQDPSQITRERNLAKVGANSSDMALQSLPAVENANISTLLRNLDEAGAARNVGLMDAGRAGTSSLDALANREKQNIGNLYNQARDTSGKSLPLEGGTFTRRASELIDEAMAGDSLPKAVESRLNAIAKGEYPLTVASAEAFKTRIGKLQRGTNDGNTRHALSLVRQALDETPLQGSHSVNPENLLAVPGTVPPSTMAGQESINAFKAARQANREWMSKVESNPALAAVVDGVEPDQFMQKFVIGKQASASDVAKLSEMLDPSAKDTMRAAIVKHLKDAATGGDSDVVKFGGKSYRNAFRALEDKLPAFFSKDEIASLRNQGEAAKYMQAQPAGSAVNNSNSGALMLGRGLDVLDRLSGKVPFGDVLVQGNIRGFQQKQALDPLKALVKPEPAKPINPLSLMLLPPTYLSTY